MDKSDCHNTTLPGTFPIRTLNIRKRCKGSNAVNFHIALFNLRSHFPCITLLHVFFHFKSVCLNNNRLHASHRYSIQNVDQCNRNSYHLWLNTMISDKFSFYSNIIFVSSPTRQTNTKVVLLRSPQRRKKKHD